MTTTQIQRTLIITAIVGFIGFATYRFLPLMHGVDFKLDSEIPQISTVPLFTLSGSIPHASTLSINGRGVPLSRSNQFRDSVLLLPGYNVITLDAEDKFGKERSHIVHVYYEPHERVAENTSVQSPGS